MDTLQILDALEDSLRGGRSDSQLLDCFVRLRDDEAFAAVVRRHGPMVLGVCRRVLRNAADADDAFQAAFLVLARKAATIGTRRLLAQWLYGVAFNTARKLRRGNTRRATREQPLAEVAEPAANTPDADDELLAILDEELNQLPERYRAVIVLCDLEGLTRREAATRLACPEGTVAGRLARARDLLAARLTARGVTSAAALLGAVFAQQAATALSPLLIAGVVRAVGVDSLAHAAAAGLVSPRVADTTEGVLRAMFLTRLWAKASAALCCGLAFACAVGAWHFANAQPTPGAGANPFAAPATGKLDPAKPSDSARGLTVIPLAKLDPEATAKVIADGFAGKGVTVAPVAKERLLLLYADEKTAAEIKALLQKLGETPATNGRVFRLAAGEKAADAGRTLDEAFNGPPTNRKPRITVVPLADANALLVYAGPTDMLTVEKLLDKKLARDAATDPAKPAEKTVTLDFQKAPWDDVLDWYAKLTGLTLITTAKPAGSLTLRPGKDRHFTVAEVTDLLNEALTQQKLMIFRRRLTFFIVPADEQFDPRDRYNRVELADLKNWGRSELVEVRIPVNSLKATEVADEVKKLLTPFGTVTAVGQTLIVGDTRGNIERILHTLEAVDGKQAPTDELDHVFKWRRAQEVAETLKTLLADKDTNVTITGTDTKGANARGKAVLIAVDPRRNAVLVTAPPGKLVLAREIMQKLDKKLSPQDKEIVPAEPVLKTYPVPAGTAAEMAKQLQAKMPWLHVVPLQKQNQIMVLATPEDHLEVAKMLPPAGEGAKPAAKKYAVKFERAQWKDVLDWYAKESGLTLVSTVRPMGALTLKPGTELTLAEVTDLLNEALLAQKWLLVRSEKTFTVVPADEKVDPKWVRRVKPEELDRCGNTELVEVVISMTVFGPDLKPLVPAADALPTAKLMLGPFGHAAEHYYTGSRGETLIVRDVAANLRKIVKEIRDIEESAAKKP